MLVTPLRDGMNLVAKEYVAARRDVNGVLVLSEFAGAADELTDAVLVNPHDDEALREAIMTAVEMRHSERTAADAGAARHRRPQRRAGLGRALLRRRYRRLPDTPRTRDRSGSVRRSRRPRRRRRRARPPAARGLDVDGVLAPIVAHAADAALLSRARSTRSARSARARRSASCPAAPSTNLARFGFPERGDGRRQPRRRAAGPAPRRRSSPPSRPPRPAARPRRAGGTRRRTRRVGRVEADERRAPRARGRPGDARCRRWRAGDARPMPIAGAHVKRGRSVSSSWRRGRPARPQRSPTCAPRPAPRR